MRELRHQNLLVRFTANVISKEDYYIILIKFIPCFIEPNHVKYIFIIYTTNISKLMTKLNNLIIIHIKIHFIIILAFLFFQLNYDLV